jgi:anti-anti-sigma regulatory factor
LDFSQCHFVDADIVDIIADFAAGAKERGISLEITAGNNPQLSNIV